MHFVSRVGIAGFLRDQDAFGEHLAGLFQFADAAEVLAELEVAGDVAGIGIKQLLESRGGRVVVAI